MRAPEKVLRSFVPRGHRNWYQTKTFTRSPISLIYTYWNYVSRPICYHFRDRTIYRSKICVFNQLSLIWSPRSGCFSGTYGMKVGLVNPVVKTAWSWPCLYTVPPCEVVTDGAIYLSRTRSSIRPKSPECFNSGGRRVYLLGYTL